MANPGDRRMYRGGSLPVPTPKAYALLQMEAAIVEERKALAEMVRLAKDGTAAAAAEARAVWARAEQALDRAVDAFWRVQLCIHWRVVVATGACADCGKALKR